MVPRRDDFRPCRSRSSMACRRPPVDSSVGPASAREADEGRGGGVNSDRQATSREARAMWTRTLTIVVAAVIAALGPAMLTSQSVVNYTAVTEQRLLNPEPHNWLMYRGTYNGW